MQVTASESTLPDLADVRITTCTMLSFPSVEDRFGTITVIPPDCRLGKVKSSFAVCFWDIAGEGFVTAHNKRIILILMLGNGIISHDAGVIFLRVSLTDWSRSLRNTRAMSTRGKCNRVGMGCSYMQLPEWELKNSIVMVGATKLEQTESENTENMEKTVTTRTINIK